ncbi:MAG: sigma-70 family RNA polymerase sigma factor [Ginsengibacter sp.]
MVTINISNQFKDYSKMLFPYAYNILRVSQDAEDAVQDVLFKCFGNERDDIKNIKGYLVKSVINQSINIKNKRKKISYEDVWLPELIATEEADANINLREIASYSLLILLEKLNPKERAVFILKEAFGYSHHEIADVLSGTVEQSRQLLSRGKSKLSSSKLTSKKTSNNIVPEGTLDKYINAIRNRDIGTLENLLSNEIIFFS